MQKMCQQVQEKKITLTSTRKIATPRAIRGKKIVKGCGTIVKKAKTMAPRGAAEERDKSTPASAADPEHASLRV